MNINKTNLGSNCLNPGGQASNSKVNPPCLSDVVGYVHALMSIIGRREGGDCLSVSSLEARRDVSSIDERVGGSTGDTENDIKLHLMLTLSFSE